MNDFYKAAAVVIVSLIFALILSGQRKEFSTIIIIIVCVYLGLKALDYLDPLLNFLRKLREISGIDEQIFAILLKAVGIGLLGEIIVLICTDAGFATMGKTLQLLTTILILWLCLPLFNDLLELIEGFLILK